MSVTTDHENSSSGEENGFCRLCEVAWVGGRCPECDLVLPQEASPGLAGRSWAAKDVLVLGIKPSEQLPRGIDAVPWEKLLPYPPDSPFGTEIQVPEMGPEELNILDRKLLVLCLPPNFQAIGTEIYEQQIVKLLFSREAKVEVLFLGEWHACPLVPFQSEIVHQDHGRYIDAHPEWDFYFSELGQWQGSFELPVVVQATNSTQDFIPTQSYRAASTLELEGHLLAKNTLGHALGASVNIYLRNNTNQWGNMENSECGKCLLLPLSKTLTAEKAVPLVLHRYYGFEPGSAPLPAWISAVPIMKAEKAYAANIKSLETQREELEDKIRLENELLEQSARFKGLLYFQSLQLEKIVCTALRHLGAVDVQHEPRGNKEDIIFADPQGRIYVAEVKGWSNKRFKIADIRQLDDYRHHYSNYETEDRKPVAFVNHECILPPWERNAACSGNEADATAKKQCLISTSRLYDTLLAIDAGTMQVDAFWDSVFSQVGIWDPKKADPGVSDSTATVDSSKPGA